MISLDNYEIWMMDYLDGILSEADEKLFQCFLDEHTHLKCELEGVNDTVLNPVDTVFADKLSLIKTEADELDLSYADYIAIKEIEGELTADEWKWRNKFVNDSSERETLFFYYKQTVLRPNDNTEFSDKNSLKRAVLFPFFTVSGLRKVGMVATVALLLGLGTLPLLKQFDKPLQRVVINDAPSLIVPPKSTAVNNIQTHESQNNITTDTLGITSKYIVRKPVDNVFIEDKQEDRLMLKPLISKNTNGVLKTKKINAYEAGLNVMMPLIIAYNIKQVEERNLAMQSHVKNESERLSKSVRALVNGMRVINFISGNETHIKKYINESGEMVAYHVESSNISISRKIKSTPVTN